MQPAAVQHLAHAGDSGDRHEQDGEHINHHYLPGCLDVVDEEDSKDTTGQEGPGIFGDCSQLAQHGHQPGIRGVEPAGHHKDQKNERQQLQLATAQEPPVVVAVHLVGKQDEEQPPQHVVDRQRPGPLQCLRIGNQEGRHEQSDAVLGTRHNEGKKEDPEDGQNRHWPDHGHPHPHQQGEEHQEQGR